MIRTLAAVSFALLAITVPAQGAGPLLVIDRWWGVDYAKSACVPGFTPWVAQSKENKAIAIGKKPRASTFLN